MRINEVLREGINRIPQKDLSYVSLSIMLMHYSVIFKQQSVVEETMDDIVKNCINNGFDIDRIEVIELLKVFAYNLQVEELYNWALLVFEKLHALAPDDSELLEELEATKQDAKNQELLDYLDDIEDIDEDILDYLSVIIEKPYYDINPEYPEALCLLMEYSIICKSPGILKSVRTLEREYPELFELAAPFFKRVSNLKKHQKLMHEYEFKLPRLEKVYNKIEELMDLEDYEYDDITEFNDEDEYEYDYDYGDEEDYDYGDEEDFSFRDEFDLESTAGWDNDNGSNVLQIEPYRRSEPKVGRNDPCPCGSGKKYKKCCDK